MVAIGPQIERQSDFMAGQHGLPFPVLSDPGNKVAAQFGLVWTAPETLRDYYRSILVNIPFMNGDQSWTLPLPATYVISPAGRVVFAEAHADFRVRPEPEEALAAAFATAGPLSHRRFQHRLRLRQLDSAQAETPCSATTRRD